MRNLINPYVLTFFRPSIRQSIPPLVCSSIRSTISFLSVRSSFCQFTRCFIVLFSYPSVLPDAHLSIFSFLCASVRPSVHPFVRPSANPFVRLCVRSDVRPSIRSLVCSLIRPLVRWFVVRQFVRLSAHSFVHLSVTSSTRSFVRSFVYPLIHSFVTSFVRSLNRLSVRPFVTKSSYLDLTEDLPHTDYQPVRRKTADYTGHRSWHQHRHQMTITTLTDLMRSTSLRSGEELCKTIMHIILI